MEAEVTGEGEYIMFFWGVVILLVGFVMYRWGKSTGSSSTREEIKKQRLRRKIAERKAAENGTQMASQTAMPAAGEKAVQAAAHPSSAHPVSHGHPGSYRHAVAAGVLGAVAGAALMHGHDEDGIQDRVARMTGAQQSGNDLPGDTFQDDSYDADDNMDSDETQDDDTAYDADESNDGAADDADDDSDYDSYFDSDSDSDSGSDDGGSFFDDGGSFFDDNDDGFF